jgi:hypothetical protein
MLRMWLSGTRATHSQCSGIPACPPTHSTVYTCSAMPMLTLHRLINWDQLLLRTINWYWYCLHAFNMTTYFEYSVNKKSCTQKTENCTTTTTFFVRSNSCTHKMGCCVAVHMVPYAVPQQESIHLYQGAGVHYTPVKFRTVTRVRSNSSLPSLYQLAPTVHDIPHARGRHHDHVRQQD